MTTTETAGIEATKDAPQVLSLEEIRARVQAHKQSATEGRSVEGLKTFDHAQLGTLYYHPLPSSAMHLYENVEQYYPLNTADPNLRGTKASNDAMDNENRERLCLKHGVLTKDGKRLVDDVVEWMLQDPISGPDNRKLALAIIHASFPDRVPGSAPVATDADMVRAFSQWEAGFHDLLVKTGWVEHWVNYVTADDASTPEAKEAARQLLKLEAAAPEWAKRLQSQQLTEALLKADEPNQVEELAAAIISAQQ